MPLLRRPDTKKVLIIGNSQVGALVASIRENKKIALFAAPGRRFKDIAVDQNGVMTGAEFLLNCPDPCKISDFARIVIYADFPEPVSVILADRQRYSSGFVKAYYRSRFEHTNAIALADQLANYCDRAAISLIPRNLSAEEDADGYPDIDLAHAHAEISELAGYDVAQVKTGIYTDIHAPDKKYFKQSLRIDGSEVDPVQRPNHARRHVSAEAGVILCENIIRELGDVLSTSSWLKMLWAKFKQPF